MRIDKFLWFCRLFKTRNLASNACKKGHVKINSKSVKPSFEIYPNTIITVKKKQISYEYEVLSLPKNRVSAKIVSLYIKDLTKKEELEKLETIHLQKNNYKFENLSIKDLKSDFEIGITTSVIMAKHVSKFMIRQKKGNILNIGSDLSFISPNQNIYSNFIKPISYSIVKHGIVGLTKYLATYLAKYNIRCNTLCPGGMYNNHNKKFLTKLSELIPMKRMAKKNELNEAMYFLISEKSSYVNGHSLLVDGGRTIW